MKSVQIQRRTFRAALAVGGFLAAAVASVQAQGITLPTPLLALAFGVTDTPTPPPTPTPTPAPTPTPTPAPTGPQAHSFPADGPIMNFTLPEGWTVLSDAGGGRLLCAPPDTAAGYTVAFARAGDLSGPDKIKAFVRNLAKDATGGNKLTGVKLGDLRDGKVGANVPCVIMVVSGKAGATPTTLVFMCFAPAPGRYVTLMARGRTDKLEASGYDVLGAIVDSIKPL